jgi:penicillin-binding protein 2
MLSIGQGSVQVTPLQMAEIAAAIANGGRIWKPRLVLDALPLGANPAGEPIPAAGVLSANLIDFGVTPEALAVIVRGMTECVNEPGGTGKQARSPLGIAGKTGTAQQKRGVGSGRTVDDNVAWFVAFAPLDAPRYALAVCVANGTAGGRTCAPIARRILEGAVAVEQGGEPPVPLIGEPISGHYDKVDGPPAR